MVKKLMKAARKNMKRKTPVTFKETSVDTKKAQRSLVKQINEGKLSYKPVGVTKRVVLPVVDKEGKGYTLIPIRKSNDKKVDRASGAKAQLKAVKKLRAIQKKAKTKK